MNPYIKDRVVKHLFYCSEKIMEQQSIEDKCFYFGMVGEILHSIILVDVTRDMIFADFVFNVVHNTIKNRLVENSVELDDEFFNKIAKIVEKYAQKISDELSVHDVLQDLVLISYDVTTTGIYINKIPDEF